MFDVREEHSPEQVHNVGRDEAQGKRQEIEVERLEGKPYHQIKLKQIQEGVKRPHNNINIKYYI